MRQLKSIGASLLFLALGAVSATAADTGKLIFGQTLPGGSLQSAPVAIAIEKGYFKEAGLDVEIVRFLSGRRGLEALLGGQVDLAFMAEYPPVIGALQNQKFAVITELGRFTGNRIIGRADLGFTSIADLAGKRVGTSLGTNAEFLTNLTLEKNGLKAEIVNLAPADIVPALERGDIQAAVPFPDYYGKAREILGERYREIVSKDYDAYMVVSASRKAIEQQPGDIKKFLAALLKASELIRNDPASAKAAVVAAAQGALSAATVDQAWAEYTFRLGFQTGLLDVLEAEAKWVEAKGIIKGASIDRAGLRGYLADGPIGALAPDLNALSK